MKKVLFILMTTLLVPMFLFANGSKETAEQITEDDGTQTLELVLMTKDSTASGFQDWIKTVEEACNLKITVIATPTNSNDRQAKVTTVLSTEDTSVDIITVNDEMYTAFKNTGWLEPINDIMTEEVIKEFPQEYLKDMVITEDGSIYSVPMYFSVLGWFVNTDIMQKYGFNNIDTYDDFLALMKASTENDVLGYADAWDVNYVFNSLGSFVNLFGGNYYDWSDEKTQEGLHALVSLLKDGYTSKAQMADQYDQVYQNLVSGKRTLGLLYTTQFAKFLKAGMYAPEGPIKMILPPVADSSTGRVAYCSSWHYVLNSASTHKAAAKRFLAYAASRQGQLDYTKTFKTFPAYMSLLSSPELDSLTGINEMREYVEKVTLRGRPIVAEAMEYISEIGNLFHRLILEEITESEFCQLAQESTKKFR